ncbi:TetR/AcrR family transcriptional regulator [Caldithrix abyssi]
MRTKPDEKARKILQAAVEIFAQKGYQQAKISEIAKKAGVAHGSVYTYYKNKEELLYQMISAVWKQFSQKLHEISKAADLDPLQKIRKMVDATFDAFTGNPQLGFVVIKEHNELRKKGIDASKEEYLHLTKSFCRVYEQGVAEGFFNPGIKCETYFHFVFGGLYHIIHRWAYAPPAIDLEEAREQVQHYVQQSLLGG